MLVELSLAELKILSSALYNKVSCHRGARLTCSPSLLSLKDKISNIELAAQVKEGNKFIHEAQNETAIHPNA